MNKTCLLLICSSLIFSAYANVFAQKNNVEDDVRISWDYSSMQKIAPKGGYPRLLRLQDSSIIVIYETRTGSVEYKRSYDNGKTWSYPIQVFTQFMYSNLSGESTIVNIANPEIKQLANGDLIIGCNYRPAKAEIAPYSIVIRRSKDNGNTWLSPQVLYNAAPRFTDGCWEPSFLQLPNGELQVYFANENPYQESEEQEISMICSFDNGETWLQKPKTVSFRKNRRDGMPVPIIGEDEMIVAIEDNYKEAFKPYTVRTKLWNNWESPVLGNSEMREYSLTTNMPDSIYIGAPYLIRLSNGQTALSYQTTEKRSSEWELSTMEVAIGDKDARNFKYRTRPFCVPLDKEAKWNSLAMWNKDTIVAVASSNFDNQDVAPWIIKGYMIPSNLIINKRSASTPLLFIGSRGNTRAEIEINEDKEFIFISAQVTDLSKSKLDGVSIYLASGKNKYKIFSNRDGNMSVWKDEKGEWLSDLKHKVEVETQSTDMGYNMLFSISKKNYPHFTDRQFYFNASLSAYEATNVGYEETIANSRIEDIGTWLKVN
ncbi:sialidase family protein [Dysgonomonas massiliensis]|uniref:sialidase family protein n=1 Tax=Dysgonomonas massiliensis TaxID=2040292 RepID=UPI000C765A3D|nr:sialidase family protein [Dysgonomonas massiliensis]